MTGTESSFVRLGFCCRHWSRSWTTSDHTRGRVRVEGLAASLEGRKKSSAKQTLRAGDGPSAGGDGPSAGGVPIREKFTVAQFDAIIGKLAAGAGIAVNTTGTKQVKAERVVAWGNQYFPYPGVVLVEKTSLERKDSF